MLANSNRVGGSGQGDSQPLSFYRTVIMSCLSKCFFVREESFHRMWSYAGHAYKYKEGQQNVALNNQGSDR